MRRRILFMTMCAAMAGENMRSAILDHFLVSPMTSRTFAMHLLTGFSIVGSVLTLVGIYSVISLSVASRRRELAIRSAIGAQRKDIRRLIFGEGFRLIAGGVIADRPGVDRKRAIDPPFGRVLWD